MESSGRIIAVLPLATGQGKNGVWRSQDYVLETPDQYPKKICFNLYGDNIDKYPVAIDDVVTISFNIESKEYNGRWYTQIKAWDVKKESVGSTGMTAQQTAAPLVVETVPPVDEGSDPPF
jgi:hypothetical protein